MTTRTAAPARKGTPAAIAAATVNVSDTLSALPTLADALAAYDNDAASGNASGATLAAVVLSRFTSHASPYIATVEGGPRVLLSNHVRDVRQHVWAEATGSVEPPAAADRTPGERSIAQYLARFSTVATDVTKGIDAMSTPADAKSAYTSILDARKGTADAAKTRRTRAAHAAYVAWRDSLPQSDRDAIARTLKLFTVSTGAIHAPAYVATVTLAASDSK